MMQDESRTFSPEEEGDQVRTEPPSPGAQEGSPGFLWRVQALFFEPRQAFADVVRHPTFLAALLLCIAVSVISTALIFSQVDMAEVMRQQIAQTPAGEQMTPDQIDQQVEQIVNSPFFSVMQWIGPIIGTPVIVLVVSAVLLLMVYLMGGETSFRNLFCVTAHAYIPYTIAYSVLAVLIFYLAQDPSSLDLQNPLYTNLGPLVNPRTSPVLYRLASSLDLLNLWVIYLLGLGTAAATRRFSIAKGVTAVAVPYVVYVAFRMGWAAIFG